MEGLSVICAGLGIIEEDDNGKCIGYSKGEYCSDNMKDLLRFLRRDDPEKRDVFKQVCRWNTLSSDLIPIILYCQEDRGLVLNAVKVIVFLTMPIEPTSVDIPQQMEYLWGLKSVIAYSDILPVVISFLESPLENLENGCFTEDDWKLVQLFLTFFRNILAIQETSTQQKAGGCAAQFLSIRDKCLELFFQENIMDLILALTLHTGSSHFYLHQDNLLLLEIFHCIFKGQDPELIATASSKSKDSKVEDGTKTSANCLQMIMEEEKQKRLITRSKNLSCYSQFSGTFTRTLLDGSKAFFKGKPSASGVPLIIAHKSHRGPARKEVWDSEKLASDGNIQLLLNEFIIQFLSGDIMSIREDIDKEQVDFQGTDVVMFFEVAHFVTSFQYHRSLLKPHMDVGNKASNSCHDDSTLFSGNTCGPIAETLNEPMFLLVISKWRYAFEGLKQTNDYKLVSVAGSLVKTMIRMLDLVLKQGSEDSNEPHTARILLYKLFYDQTEEGLTHFLFSLIKSFNPHKQSKCDLTNLVECVYLTLLLLENLQERGTLRVSKKSRKKKMKKSINKNMDSCDPNGHCDTPKNDAANTTPEQSFLGDTLGNDTAKNHSSDAELDKCLRNMSEDETLQQLPSPRNKSDVDDKNVAVNNDFQSDIDKSSDDELPPATTEVDLKVSSLVSALANHAIIQKLCWLLSNYKSNSTTTNHYIVSMLGKVCHDLDLSPMLYQLSFINIFYDILKEQKARPCKEYEEMVTFLTTIIRRMLRKMKSYPLLFVEILFRKTTKECRYINCGSILNEIKDMKTAIHEGEFGTGIGVKISHGLRRSIADALGDDDFETSFPIDQEKSPEELDESSSKENEFITGDEMRGRIQDNLHEKKHKAKTSNVTKDSTDEYLANGWENSSFGKPMRSQKRVHAFSSMQEEKIKELFHQFKDHKRRSYMIAQALDGNGKVSAAQITYKLKQLGLFVPKKKRSEAKMQLADEVSTDLSSDGSDDDETLSSLKARGKLNRNESMHDGNHHKIGQRSHEDISVDELHGDFATHKKRKLRRIDDEPVPVAKNSVESEAYGEESLISERSGSVHSQMGVMELESATGNHSKYSETGSDGVNIVLGTESLFDNMVDDDILADSGENAGSNYTMHENSSASRRRMKMFIDFEDDDE